MYNINKDLIGNICEQLRTCLLYIRNNSISTERHLLCLETQHLELILKLLCSDISITSCLENYKILFENENKHGHLSVYKPQLKYLNNKKHRSIVIDENIKLFIKILQICCDNIKNYLNYDKLDLVGDEDYYNHNVPSLIETKNKDLIKYYLTIECTSCKRHCSKEMVQRYEDIWEEISKQFQ